jgi:transcription elongation factor SPT6
VANAIKLLASRDVGDVLLRPSSRGLMNLSLTLKVYDGVYTHVDIKEGGKDLKNSANNLRLGSPLFIGEEQYEDLDEVCSTSLPGRKASDTRCGHDGVC